ncbi:MAG: polymer-forming cytoskeletal protein [Verrucomicrobiota bacterium]
MPAIQQVRVQVSCPDCGHQQLEPPKAVSTVCKKCGKHFDVQQGLHPTPKATKTALKLKRVTCFDCGTENEAPATAESTMCKRCSRYIDLKDYRIANAVSKNFNTKGTFVVEAKGYVFNTEAIVGEAVLKGRFLGKLTADRLTIYSGAEIKGSFSAAHFIIPAENHFHWKEQIKVGSGEIAGELSASIQASGTMVLKSTARLFGDLKVKNLVIEEGAIVVGHLRVG